MNQQNEWLANDLHSMTWEWLTPKWLINDLRMTCKWLTFKWLVNDLVFAEWLVNDLYKIVNDLQMTHIQMTCEWLGFCRMTCKWLANDSHSMTCEWLGFCRMTCEWLMHDLWITCHLKFLGTLLFPLFCMDWVFADDDASVLCLTFLLWHSNISFTNWHYLCSSNSKLKSRPKFSVSVPKHVHSFFK